MRPFILSAIVFVIVFFTSLAAATSSSSSNVCANNRGIGSFCITPCRYVFCINSNPAVVQDVQPYFKCTQLTSSSITFQWDITNQCAPTTATPSATPTATPTPTPTPTPTATPTPTPIPTFYPASPDAAASLVSDINLTITQVSGVGYYFAPKVGPAATSGGPNVTRGIIVLPENKIDYLAYAPLARQLALKNYFVALLDATNQDVDQVTPTVRQVLAENPKEFWAVVGHGQGGVTASLLVQAFYPKLKALGLVGSALDPSVDLSDLLVPAATIYGTNDNIVPASVSRSNLGSTLPNTALDYPVVGANHGSIAYIQGEIYGDGPATVTKAAYVANVVGPLVQLIALAHYPAPMKEVLHYANMTNGSPYEIPVPVSPLKQNFYKTGGEPDLADKSWHVFQPFYPSKVAYIHYVGAACPEAAYFKFASDLADKGVTVFIPRLSLAYGAYGYNVSELIIAAYPNITNWAVGGHSYGSIAAAMYINTHPNQIKAFLSYAGNVCAGCNFTNTNIKALQMWGSRDTIGVGPASRFYTNVVTKLPADTVYRQIEGGNHYQMGYYGYQYPDSIPTISREAQHAEMVAYSDLVLAQFKY